MVINKKRIRNLDLYVPQEYKGRPLHFGVADLEQHRDQILRAGLIEPWVAGNKVLPAIIGPVTRFNAEGKETIRRDQPKETLYRQIEWSWTEHHGQTEVEQSDFRYVPYERYPRESIPPPGVELQMRHDGQGRLIVATDPIEHTDTNREAMVHAINICLETFRECEVLTEDLESATRATERLLNWDILPQGRHPWARITEMLTPVIERAKKGNQGVIWRRLETIHKAGPAFQAKGLAGFHGYIVFGFPAKNLYVLESAYYGNATYVFEKDWEDLSRLSKAEILNSNLQKDRIVHTKGWEKRVRQMLGQGA